MDEEKGKVAGFGVVSPISGIAWQMFTQTGMPGFYLLYRDIERGDKRTPLD